MNKIIDLRKKFAERRFKSFRLICDDCSYALFYIYVVKENGSCFYDARCMNCKKSCTLDDPEELYKQGIEENK